MLREATPYGQTPRFLIRDHDGKFGGEFAKVAKTLRIEVRHTPDRAPRANALCARFLGSVRRECLDHLLIMSEGQLYRVLRECVMFLNGPRPHQGIDQKFPEKLAVGEDVKREGKIIVFPVLNSLHHDYRKAARGTQDAVIGAEWLFGPPE